MKRGIWLTLLVSTLVFMPQVANANAGTPLMWAGMIHLVLGNAVIGLGEGLLLAWIFKRPKPRCIGLMIAANYFSAWVGGGCLTGYVSTLFDWNLYTAWRLFWWFALGTYLVTILLEWPLVALCFWRQENWLKRSLKASLLLQTISYIGLFGWYWGASGKSLYTEMTIVPPATIQLPANLQLFYISATDGQVRENTLKLDGIVSTNKNERLLTAVTWWFREGVIISTNRNDRLLIRALPDQTNAWRLMLRLDARRDEDSKLVPVGPEMEGISAAVEPIDEHQKNGRDTWFHFGPAMKASDNMASDWTFKMGFWPIEGLKGENANTKQKVRFAWETLFSRWPVRNAIQLPNDQVIFQLGEDQICVLEPQTKRIALLARGRGPAVVMK